MKGIRIDSNPETISDRTHSYEWGLSNKDPKVGISVCKNWEGLVDYFSAPTPGKDGGRVKPWNISDSYVVTVQGEESPDDDHDHGESGNPYLVADANVVEYRQITAKDVAELIWGNRDAKSAADLEKRLNEMQEEWTREECESAFGLTRKDGYNLSLLFCDASGSYVVSDELNGEVVCWNDSVGEYQAVPVEEIS